MSSHPISTAESSAHLAQEVPSSSSLRVFGVGGAGCNAVAHLARELLEGVSFLAMNTDAAALAQSPVADKFTLGAKTTRGLGAGGDPERGRAAAEEDATTLRARCEGARIVFVVAGLGGGTGTGAGPVVARIARETGALVLGVVMLPFDCEGRRRQSQAQAGLQELKTAADAVICLPNQKLLQQIDEKTSLLDAFRLTNDLVAQAVRGIWRLMTRPGLINVDFADLCAVTQSKHTESTLATAEARGENRAREVLEKLLAHPLLEGGQALNESSGVLVSIAGGPDLTMTELTRVTEQLQRHCEQAHLILGATIDETFADRLCVTLVAARRPAGDAQDAPEPANPFAPPPAGRRSNTGTRVASAFEPSGETLLASDEPSSPRLGTGGARRKKSARMLQGQLPLEIVTKGRFEKSEPTILHGQDLDLPTYIRRGVALN